jgi:hypothetical protein
MYLSIEDGSFQRDLSDLLYHSVGGFEFHWKGHLFIEGHAAGESSLSVFAQYVEDVGIQAAAAHLRGIFVLLVQQGYDYAVMVDNAGLYRVYLTRQRLANSFLRLLDGREGAARLDRRRAVEFLAYGACNGRATLVPTIRTLGNRTIVRFSERSGVRWFDSKVLAGASTVSGIDVFERYCQALVTACRGKVVGADLTGGFDSRLLVTKLTHYGALLELGVSGPPMSPDVLIAERVATALGQPLHHQLPPSGGKIIDELDDLLAVCDGMLSPVEHWPTVAMQRDRRTAGIELLVSGNGGELLKDFWWWQDFPFYGCRSPNLARLFRYRMHPLPLATRHLTAMATRHYDRVVAGTLRRMRRLATARNTETYDNIYFFMRQNAGGGPAFSFVINNFFDIVVPYLECTNFLFARALPVRARMFNAYHRTQLSRTNQTVASLPTTSGLTSSAAAVDVTGDAIRYGRWAFARLLKKVREVHLQRPMAPMDWQDEALHTLRASMAAARSLNRAKAIGLLAGEVQPADLSLQELSRLLTIAMLVDRYRLVVDP